VTTMKAEPCCITPSFHCRHILPQ